VPNSEQNTRHSDQIASKEAMNRLRLLINQWAGEYGFQALGITDMDMSHYIQRFDHWLASGYHADMGWIADRHSLRTNPEELVEGTARVISLRMNYRPPDTEPLKILKSKDTAYISRYALGRDYHKLIRSRLAKIAKKIEQWSQENLGNQSIQRAFVDSAPVLEKPMAEKAGLGWIGKNTLLMNRDAGSWFFLGEIFTNLPLITDNHEEKDECGKCKACLKVCPTDAFPEPYVLDAAKCISYLTIENKGPIPKELRSKIGNRVFGCDDCQLICPWNRYSKHSSETDFTPRHNLDQASLVHLFAWTEKEFLDRTAGSPIRRAGYTGWQRNLAVGVGNGSSSKSALKTLSDQRTYWLTTQKSDANNSALVLEHVEWAIHRLESKLTETQSPKLLPVLSIKERTKK